LARYLHLWKLTDPSFWEVAWRLFELWGPLPGWVWGCWPQVLASLVPGVKVPGVKVPVSWARWECELLA
jgi:hypothetical protein